MNPARRQAISMILNDATVKVGKNEIFRLSAMRPPVFDNKNDLDFFTDSIELVSKLQLRFNSQINADKQ
jgi:hypothetical protein